jgi:uncharacterized membrane protein
MSPALVLAADTTTTQLRWRSLPDLWLVVMVLLPLVIGFVWWVYRREAKTAPARWKRVLGALRVGAIVAVMLMLFEPYAESALQRTVRANLIVLVDTSASMSFADRYADATLAASLREAADLPPGGRVEETPRLDLVRGVLGNETLGVLGTLRERFVLHVYTFDQDLRPLWSESGGNGDESRGDLGERVASLEPAGELSRIGDALDAILEEFRLRDEPLAGIVLVSDGRRHGGQIEPEAAARKAATLRTPVPVHTVVVGDPEEAQNVHVTNLRAKEVVLAGDQASFEFTIRAQGFEGTVVPVVLVESTADAETEPLERTEVLLPADGEEVQARVTHRFGRAGSYLLRIGVPTQPGEKITNDNFLVHPIQVIDRKIRVLYVDGYPRHEFKFLSTVLTGDSETLEAQTLNLDADPGYVQLSSRGVPALEHFPHTRREVMEYDVILLGDVDWKDLSTDPADAERDLENLRAFVDAGGGLGLLSGEYHMPQGYRSTPLRPLLPIVVDPEEESRIRQDPTRSVNLRLTEDGRTHPIMLLEDDPDRSRDLWQEEGFSAFFWYYPAARKKEIARALAVHPTNTTRNREDRHPIFVTMRYGRGRVFWSAIDSLWRLRFVYEDRYYKRFWGEVIRDLATYRLKGRNRRFKIFTEDRYFVGEEITIRARVLDPDYNPSQRETQTVILRTPDGKEIEIVLRAEPDPPRQLPPGDPGDAEGRAPPDRG